MANTLLEEALQYASHGWKVFPLQPGAKVPLTAHGLKDATTDAGQIRSWWTDIPDANIGIATGADSGIVVLDVDSKLGKDGYGSVNALGLQPDEIPLQVNTPSGGVHLYFAANPTVGTSVEKLGPGLDTRGDGGYVVAPPSQVNGKAYRWRSTFTAPLGPVPDVILRTLKGAGPANGRRSIEEWKQILDGVGEGSRQENLPIVVGKLYAGLEPDLARHQAHAWNAQNDPPLPDADIDSCCDRIEAREKQKKSNVADFVPLETVAIRAVPWLWPGYLPKGAVSLLIGDPGKGKTLFALDLAARVSAGASWPDGLPNPHGPQDVLVMSAEDSAEYTIRPRLEAAGGNASRVHILTVPGGSFSLREDLDRLERTVLRTGAQLLVIDPLASYLPGIDENRNNEVRSSLAPLVDLAGRLGLTILAVIHMGKNIERNAMQRILGSTAFGALARAVYLVSEDPDDERRRLFLPVKFNLGKAPAGLAFRPEGVEVQGIPTVWAHWETNPVTAHADDVLRRLVSRSSEAQKIEAEIREALAEGPVLVEDMVQRIGKPERTLRRYRKRMGVEVVRDPADTTDGPYYWLPLDWSPEDREAWFRERTANRVHKAVGNGSRMLR